MTTIHRGFSPWPVVTTSALLIAQNGARDL
jgi:hypothetical protein